MRKYHMYIGCPSINFACLRSYRIVIILATSTKNYQGQHKRPDKYCLKRLIYICIFDKVVIISNLPKNLVRKVCVYEKIVFKTKGY